MADVFEVLGRDHTEVKRMLDELEAGPTAATGASENALERRRTLLQKLITAESMHEAVEEEYFWPTVREHVPDGDALADHAIVQEQSGKQELDDLIAVHPLQDRFEGLLSDFIAGAREHIDFEEEQVWPRLRGVITAEQATGLGGRLQAAKRLAPTRPHSNTPPKPGLLKATAPVVGVADRMLDRMTGRDRG
ncbi:hemerythrin domain-containing protein [Actinomadura nitritigenes]|uniref:Hemerythrin domain-containing protein n=1 Tax=Actinomadura nitritigenes TaxID=134602 RepID=A0ABS3QVV3_9ACTN|nr:hemerythrin domain-containing protein [Actinomadura nitritigenes]MBO2437573.1 hemerythrin domain-containing protein [Actinomadura nitritigenes]